MQRYFAKNKNNNNIILEQSDIHHIKNVMRNKTNDKIEVIYDKVNYLCNIDDIEDCSLSIVEEVKEDNELNIELIMACSLVKEQKMDLILQKMTELGVSKIIPVQTERSIVKIDRTREQKKIIRWQSICKEASEQSHRNVVPLITNVMNLKDLVKEDADIKILCSVNEKSNLLNRYLHEHKKYVKIIVVIGPEGGFSPKEEEFLMKNNFDSISLGKRVLRVETATMYVASVINFCSME